MLGCYSDWSLQMEKVLSGFIPPVPSSLKSFILKLHKINLLELYKWKLERNEITKKFAVTLIIIMIFFVFIL